MGSRNSRLGLVGMKERVEMVDGTLVIASSPGQGTRLTAKLPFKPAA
jgi:signal transduction histidine kinase